MDIAFFISDHGYGHLTRNLEIARELLNRGHRVSIITGKRHGAVAVAYLEGRTAIRECHTDAGLVLKPGTLEVDAAATERAVRAHHAEWDSLIAGSPAADLYIADIVPWALLAAKRKGIPSCILTNFTWIEQYESFLPEDLLEEYRKAFRSRDHAFYYDLASESCRSVLGEGADIGFSARAINRDRVREIKARHRRPLVFISVGMSNDGFQEGFDVGDLPYDFVSTFSVKLRGDNVTTLPADTPNTQDYVAAADYCIAKAGWSTVAEMMLAGVPFAALNRPDVAEDTMTIREIERRCCGIGIDVADLWNMGAVMERLSSLQRYAAYPNNSRAIAAMLENLGLRK